jgi:pimeloyl-ACP methyl ester carboxylesterase
VAGALAQRRLMQRIAEDPENELLRTPPEGSHESVRASDGTSLHVETFRSESAAADAPTVVLAHGWTENIDVWTYVIRDLLPRGFRIVAYDLRGHGKSERAADGDYSIARFGDDLDAVLEACVPDGGRAVVAGHSLGAMSIVAWAGRHDAPKRAAGVALLNTGVSDLVALQLLVPVPPIAQGLNTLVATHGFLGSRAPLPHFSTPVSHAAVRYVAFGPRATPAQVAFYERMLITCPPDIRANVGIAMSRMNLLGALPRLTVPTLVMAGAKDRLTPPVHARRIADGVPELQRLIVLPETGHMGPLEAPREVSDALSELVTAVTAPSGAVAA